MLAGDLPRVARAALGEGEAGLSAFHVRVLTPVQPMLADSAESVEDAVTALGDAALEYKLDGARIQVHKAGEIVRVYSRGLRDVTAAVPEVVEAVAAFPARDAILDGEVIVLRPDGTPVPFQDTMRRFGRRLDVEALRQQLPLTPFFFDLLAVDGRDVLDEPQSGRFAALQQLVPAPLVIPHAAGVTAATARAFLEGALARGHEGVMAKSRGAPYAAGNRGSSWLKVKAVRTLDLVVLAVEWGSGRRKGWLSNLHLGARDPATGGFVMLGKTFKGMTDALLEWQTRELLAREVGRETTTWCTSGRSWSSRSRSTTCRPALTIPGAWRCGSPGSKVPDRQDRRRGRHAYKRSTISMAGRRAPRRRRRSEPCPSCPTSSSISRRLRPRIVGQTLERVRLATPFLLRSVEPPLDAATGRTVTGLRRIGKRIVLGSKESCFSSCT